MNISNVISLIIISYIIRLSLSLNTGIGNDVSWWQSTSDFIPTHSTQYGQLELRDALYMEFDIIYHGPTPSQWQNIFRIGFPSNYGSCEYHNSRYPSLWLPPNQNEWHFSISETAKCGKEWPNRSQAALNFKYHVIIHYNQSHIFVSVNDIITIDTSRTPTLSNLIGKTMYVWISTDDYNHPPVASANVTMSNIIIISYWYNESFTLSATPPSTHNPTVNPTKYSSIGPTLPSLNHNTNAIIMPSQHPTMDPSSNPTDDPTNDPAIYPTMFPTIFPTTLPTVQPTIYSTINPTVISTSTPFTYNPTTTSPSAGNVTVSKTDKHIDIILTLILSIMVGISLLCILALCVLSRKKKKITTPKSSTFENNHTVISNRSDTESSDGDYEVDIDEYDDKDDGDNSNLCDKCNDYKTNPSEIESKWTYSKSKHSFLIYEEINDDDYTDNNRLEYSLKR